MFKPFERNHEELISRREFAGRLFWFVVFGIAIEVFIVGSGATAFHFLEGLDWLASAVNATMIVTGNGPPHEAQTTGGQYFQIFFSLMSVITSALVVSVVLAPVFHRVLHSFNADPAKGKDDAQDVAE